MKEKKKQTLGGKPIIFSPALGVCCFLSGQQPCALYSLSCSGGPGIPALLRQGW